MKENICECLNWCRSDIRIVNGAASCTDHHPNCDHYNDSLIDVWKVEVDGVCCYLNNEGDAIDTAGDSAVITKERMHREVFENMPEFQGF